MENIIEFLAIIGNATFTLVAIVIISLILDEAGFFRWLALHVARWGRGKGRSLWVLVILLAALVTALLTNDGTMLIWIPTVMEILLALGFSSQATIAFLIATGFIADVTSLPLPISNLVNIITTDYFDISFLRYALVMIPINFVAIASSLGVLWFYFHPSIPDRYSLADLKQPSTAIRDPLVFRWSFVILGMLLISYFLTESVGIPVSLVAGLGAWVMLALAGRLFHKHQKRVISISKILKEAPWKVILFSLVMYSLVIGLRNLGLTSFLTQGLEHLSYWGITLASVGTGFFASLLSGIINNLPAVLINNIAIKDTTAIDPAIKEAMVYANIIGCDVGAKITPIGSLGTLLWMHILARKGLHISWRDYFRISIPLTIPVLFVTLLSLAMWLPWLIA